MSMGRSSRFKIAEVTRTAMSCFSCFMVNRLEFLFVILSCTPSTRLTVTSSYTTGLSLLLTHLLLPCERIDAAEVCAGGRAIHTRMAVGTTRRANAAGSRRNNSSGMQSWGWAPATTLATMRRRSTGLQIGRNSVKLVMFRAPGAQAPPLHEIHRIIRTRGRPLVRVDVLVLA